MTIYNTISANKTKTWFIMFCFVIFVIVVAYVFDQALGYGGSLSVFALPFALFSTVGSYFYSDKMVLATSGAKQIEKKNHPELFRLVENLAIGNGQPMPKIYIM